ncbi:MAG: hypothetical protein KAI15_10175 [Gammaproteobacteria bacterium]|nr:hypothetical protein [Gammaproteobacteria bacterium]
MAGPQHLAINSPSSNTPTHHAWKDLKVETHRQKKSTHPCMLRESAISEKVNIDKLIKGKYNYSELTRFTSATQVDI